MHLPIEIKHTQDPAIIRRLGEFRVRAWIEAGAQFKPGFLDSAGQWLDELDLSPDTHHWVALYHGRIVGAARLSYHRSLDDVPDAEQFAEFENELAFPLAAFSRLFVIRDFWGMGISSALLDARLAFLQSHQPVKNIVAFTCGVERTRAMQKCGFRVLATRPGDSAIIIPKKFYVLAAEVDANSTTTSTSTNESRAASANFV